MKVLLINGSPHPHGCTCTALTEVASALEAPDIECELVQLGSQPVRDCIGCWKCTDNRCVFSDDIVNSLLEKAEHADGFVFGTPVYFAHPSGRVLCVMDRLFAAGGALFSHKPAAAVASARRAGTTASLDVLYKHFTIAEMPVVSSSYWCMVHGNTPEEVRQDLEGLQTMRNLGRNMAWLLRCIRDGQMPPESESGASTNFIR